MQELIQACQKENFKNTGQAIEYFREQAEFELFNQLASHPYPSLIDDVKQEWQALMAKLVCNQESELDALLELSKTRDLSADEKRILLSLLQQGKR